MATCQDGLGHLDNKHQYLSELLHCASSVGDTVHSLSCYHSFLCVQEIFAVIKREKMFVFGSPGIWANLLHQEAW